MNGTLGSGCAIRCRRGTKTRCLPTLRLQLGLPDQTFFTDRGFGSLGFLEQQAIGQTLAPGFFREHNPIVRHTVLRRRQTLEEAGLLEKVGVDIHPDSGCCSERLPWRRVQRPGSADESPVRSRLSGSRRLDGSAAASARRAAGFMKTLLLQRICSSFASGRSTAEKMLRREMPRRGRGADDSSSRIR